jgi:hypothetical protein
MTRRQLRIVPEVTEQQFLPNDLATWQSACQQEGRDQFQNKDKEMGPQSHGDTTKQ